MSRNHKPSKVPSQAQLRVLRLLANRGPMYGSDLAALVGIRFTAVDACVSRGWVRKDVDEDPPYPHAIPEERYAITDAGRAELP